MFPDRVHPTPGTALRTYVQETKAEWILVSKHGGMETAAELISMINKNQFLVKFVHNDTITVVPISRVINAYRWETQEYYSKSGFQYLLSVGTFQPFYAANFKSSQEVSYSSDEEGLIKPVNAVPTNVTAANPPTRSKKGKAKNPASLAQSSVPSTPSGSSRQSPASVKISAMGSDSDSGISVPTVKVDVLNVERPVDAVATAATYIVPPPAGKKSKLALGRVPCKVRPIVYNPLTKMGLIEQLEDRGLDTESAAQIWSSLEDLGVNDRVPLERMNLLPKQFPVCARMFSAIVAHFGMDNS